MIDVRELHIGSFVKTNRGEVIRVDSISTKRQHRKIGYHHANDPYHIHYVRLAQCEPIQLTMEMLVVNGFMYSECWHGWYLNVGGNNFALDDTGRHWTTVVGGGFSVAIDYVHQLQAALMMCGLEDIADKLIVERQ